MAKDTHAWTSGTLTNSMARVVTEGEFVTLDCLMMEEEDAPGTSENDNEVVYYTAKCERHLRIKEAKRQSTSSSTAAKVRSKGNESDDDNNAKLESDDDNGVDDDDDDSMEVCDLPPTSQACTCIDPNCQVRKSVRLKRKMKVERAAAARRRRQKANKKAGLDEDTMQNTEIFERFHQECPELEAARISLVKSAGGEDEAEDVYFKCSEVCKRQNLRVSENEETVLMRLCTRLGETHQEKTLINGQIYAMIRIYIERSEMDLPFVRNAEGISALEYASLANKPEVSVYLARLAEVLYRDPNEAGTSEGHTVLHLLARKGDESADALEALLKMRRRQVCNGKNTIAPPLFALDTVNRGRKTPLDVAYACAEIFSTGEKRTIYKRTIDLFHEAINEEASLIETAASMVKSKPFRNI